MNIYDIFSLITPQVSELIGSDGAITKTAIYAVGDFYHGKDICI